MRPGWDETWISVALVISRRSRCARSQAGAVIVDVQNRICAVGYNGPPAGFTAAPESCMDWCPRAKTGGSLSYDDCVSAHAEANALMVSNRLLHENGKIYVTRMPCFMCAKMIANSGLREVITLASDDDIDRQPERSIDMFLRSGLIHRYAPMP